MSGSFADLIDREHVLDLVRGLGSFRRLSYGGNLGDALIQFATVRAFEESGLEFDRVDDDSSLVFPGGGHLIPLWNSRLLLDRVGSDRPVLILPHTMRGVATLFRSRPHLQAIARDRVTWQHLIDGGVPRERLFLSHDAAFWLEPWVKKQEWGPSAGSLLAFRGDAESSRRFGDFDALNFDVSRTWISMWDDVDDATRAGKLFLSFLARFETIVTDRLHVAIGAALLGKDCYLFANSYGKNRAVWEMSLRGRFDNVRWCDSPDEIPRSVLSAAVGRTEAEAAWIDQAGFLQRSDLFRRDDRRVRSRVKRLARRRSAVVRYGLDDLRRLDMQGSLADIAAYVRLRRRHSGSGDGVVRLSPRLSVLEPGETATTLACVDDWTQHAHEGDHLAVLGYREDRVMRSQIDDMIDRYPMFDYFRVNRYLIMSKAR